MDEHPESALHYGHVGKAVYSPDTRSWAFTRSFKQPSIISSTGITRTTVPSPLHESQRQRFTEHLPSAGQSLLPKVLPDLASNWTAVKHDAFSRAVANTIKRYDPQSSTLLDIGYADPALEDLNARQSVAIAAAVSGECGNTITFRVLAEDSVQIGNNDPELQIPCIGNKIVTEWSRRGAPILQICFAHSLEERPHWMAARLSDATVIFRPRLFRREAVPMYVPDNDIAMLTAPRQNSPLDANPVVNIPIGQTGGVPHADVTFNPWYPRQFGIVDIEGHWSIWEITGHHRKRKSGFAAKCTKRGLLPWMDPSQNPDGPQHDGWASIEWIGDVSTVLVSDRRCVMVCQILGEDGQQPSPVELGLSLQSEWVLDVRRSAQNTSQFFVLTTTRLLWFDISSAPRNLQGEMPPLNPRLAWRHFRDPEDTTLRLCDGVMGDTLHIILYSRLSTLVQTFQIPVIKDEETDTGSVPDSVMLDIPSTIEVSSLGEISHTPYSTLVFRQIGYAPTNPAITDYNTNLTLIKLFWSDASHAVHETVFRGPDIQGDEEDNLAEESHENHTLHLRETASHLRRMRPKLAKEVEQEEDVGFIVDDWDESTFAPPRAGIKKSWSESRERDASFDSQWTLNMTSIYEAVVKNLLAGSHQSTSESLQPRPTLNELTQGLANKTLETLAGWKATETMLEFSETRPLLDDIDEGAENLARLVKTALESKPSESESQPETRFMILPLHLSKLFYGAPNVPVPPGERSRPCLPSGLNYLETYEQLVADWVSSVPHGPRGIPDQTRVLKEKMIREISLDLCLARLVRIGIGNGAEHQSQVSQAVIQPEPEPATQSQSQPASQGTAISLLSSQWQPSGQINPSQNNDSSQPPQPPNSSTNEPAIEEQPYSNLASFTTFRQPTRTPRNITMLLSHWKPSTDPSTYEWTKTSQMLENEELQRTSASVPGTPRSSRSKRSGSRSRSRSLAPDTHAHAHTVLPPTPVAPMIRASQPSGGGLSISSSIPLTSSQPTVDDLPMTQGERGPFGTRDVKKLSKMKKKRRAAGF